MIRIAQALLLPWFIAVLSLPAANGELSITAVQQTPLLVKQPQSLASETVLAVANAGPAMDGWIKIAVAGKDPVIQALGPLAPGKSAKTVLVPELDKDGQNVRFELFGNERCTGRALAAQTLPQAKVRHWTVYVNHDMHQDVGYTAHQEQLKRQVWPGYLDATFKHIAESDDWPEPAKARRGIESSMMLFDSALPCRSADWQEMLKRHIAAGRIGYSATYGNMAQENMSAEELARSCYYSRRHLRDMLGGGDSAAANMGDNDSLSWSVVDAFAEAGIKYYTFQVNNDTARWSPPDGNMLYYVEGRKPGNRLLVYDCGPYVVDHFKLRNGKLDAVREALAKTLMGLQSRKNYPYNAYFSWFDNGDNGPTSPEVYRSIRDFNALGYEYPKLVSALPEAFYQHIEKEFADEVPVYRGTIENWWNFGVGSTAYETAAHKANQDRLAAAEMLATLAAAKIPGQRYPYEDLADAWRNMMLYCEHTWGAASSAVDSQWFWKRNTALAPEVLAGKVFRQSLTAVSSLVPTTGKTVVVYNFLPWTRSDVVRMAAEGLPKHFDLVETAGGNTAKSQRIEGQVVFVAADVPGMGYKTYRVVERADEPQFTGGVKATPNSLENEFFRIVVDGAGGVTSIIDKTHGGAELVDPTAPHRMNDFVYYYERKNQHTVERARLSSDLGPVQGALTADGRCFGVDSMQRTVVLYDSIPRIDFINDVVKSPSGFGAYGRGWPKEEGYFVFPLNVPNFLLRHELPTGNARPLVDPNPGEPEQIRSSSTDHYTVNRWIDVSNQADYGVGLAPLDAPLVMYGGRTALTFNLTYKAPKPWIYSYVFTNLWHTNFQKTQPGRVVFRYSLRPRSGADWLAGGTHRFGLEANSPLRAAVIAGAQQGDPKFDAAKGQWLAISRPNVILTAAKLAEANGEGIILRLTEIEGKATEVSLDLGFFGPASVVETDLVENDRKPLELKDGAACIHIEAYGWKTLRIIGTGAPQQVAGITATTTDRGTLVAWNESSAGPTATVDADRNKDVACYEIFRGTGKDFAPGPGSYLTTTSANRCFDRQVAGELRNCCFYKVRAVRAGRKGPFSAAVEATPGELKDEMPPTPPVVSATALRYNKIALAWEPSADNVVLAGYRVFRDGRQIADLETVYNTWVDLRVEPDQQYVYTVKAVDEAGNESPASNEASVSTKGFVVNEEPPSPDPNLPAMTRLRPAPVLKPGNLAPKATVSVSSEFSSNFDKSGLADGIAAVHEVGEWSSRSEPRPWVRLEWKEPQTISRVVLYDRANPSDHAIAGRLTFSDGTAIEVSGIANDGSPKEAMFPAKTVKWLRFEVTESRGTNIGLSEIEAFSPKK